MANNDNPVGPRFDEHESPPSAPEPPADGRPVGTILRDALVPAAIAVTAGGVILVVAIAWGAAEAAVGVGAAYLVYSAATGRTDLSGALAVRLLTSALRSQPTPIVGAPRAG
jgi:hypothetical protein